MQSMALILTAHNLEPWGQHLLKRIALSLGNVLGHHISPLGGVSVALCSKQSREFYC
ncbi:uncharacterized protein PHALS_00194 [Plasmopara halstedii]|uniref:Uncharacterized protein n=1 Tax=Plasmopara halstedii TaxID=4781 RepID=A0A0P1A656_PLAHL|nr:uncharacterized protein PHALS_00194 [Plasmopara halstedii]CEG35865.1 hypothetical protein PHALS_00194 [Plasmopara halstedii]|eukprot:XP_024572234.1 hypothetical protein PHALS_00194 [Plasmopara halstedii]